MGMCGVTSFHPHPFLSGTVWRTWTDRRQDQKLLWGFVGTIIMESTNRSRTVLFFMPLYLMKPPVPGSNSGTGILEIFFLSFFLSLSLSPSVRRQANVCSAHSAIPALGFSLSQRFCSCAGIVLQIGCQVSNRVTDVCGESIIHGITSEISMQPEGGKCVCSGKH
jgi:hypothetical protein